MAALAIATTAIATCWASGCSFRAASHAINPCSVALHPAVALWTARAATPTAVASSPTCKFTLTVNRGHMAAGCGLLRGKMTYPVHMGWAAGGKGGGGTRHPSAAALSRPVARENADSASNPEKGWLQIGRISSDRASSWEQIRGAAPQLGFTRLPSTACM